MSSEKLECGCKTIDNKGGSKPCTKCDSWDSNVCYRMYTNKTVCEYCHDNTYIEECEFVLEMKEKIASVEQTLGEMKKMFNRF